MDFYHHPFPIIMHMEFCLRGQLCGLHPLIKPHCWIFALVFIAPVWLVWKSVGSQGTGGLWENVGLVCVRARECGNVCASVCPCVLAAFVFLSQFYIPALRGRVLPLSPPPLF